MTLQISANGTAGGDTLAQTTAGFRLGEIAHRQYPRGAAYNSEETHEERAKSQRTASHTGGADTGEFGLGGSVLAADLDPLWVVQWPGYDRGTVSALAISGNDAFVAVGGVHVLDISDPVKPRRVAVLKASGSACGIALSGHYAYIADY